MTSTSTGDGDERYAEVEHELGAAAVAVRKALNAMLASRRELTTPNHHDFGKRLRDDLQRVLDRLAEQRALRSPDAEPTDDESLRVWQRWQDTAPAWAPVMSIGEQLERFLRRHLDATEVGTPLLLAAARAVSVLAGTENQRTIDHLMDDHVAGSLRAFRLAMRRLTLEAKRERDLGNEAGAALLESIARSLALELRHKVNAARAVDRESVTIPTQRALAPPGRAIVAQPIAAHAPPAGWASAAA